MKKRTPIKTISKELIPFTPDEYEDMDKNATSIYERPLIFWGRLLTREERLEMQDLTDVEYKRDREEIDMANIKLGDMKITGQGIASKFVWDKCIKKAENVILDDNGKIEEHDEFTDMKKLWNTKGIDLEVAQSIKFFVEQSSFTEPEAKN